jgi:hypothetical protein
MPGRWPTTSGGIARVAERSERQQAAEGTPVSRVACVAAAHARRRDAVDVPAHRLGAPTQQTRPRRGNPPGARDWGPPALLRLLEMEPTLSSSPRLAYGPQASCARPCEFLSSLLRGQSPLWNGWCQRSREGALPVWGLSRPPGVGASREQADARARGTRSSIRLCRRAGHQPAGVKRGSRSGPSEKGAEPPWNRWCRRRDSNERPREPRSRERADARARCRRPSAGLCPRGSRQPAGVQRGSQGGPSGKGAEPPWNRWCRRRDSNERPREPRSRQSLLAAFHARLSVPGPSLSPTAAAASPASPSGFRTRP